MQNTVKKTNITTTINNIISFPKLTRTEKKARTEQQDSQLIIEYLEGALIMNREIEVQMNNSFYSDTIQNFSGYLFQGKTGQLLLSQEFSSTLVEIDPKMIRSVHFVNKAA